MLLVVAELIIGRERRSKKLNMVDKIVQETLEKRLLATHITVQVHTNRFSFRYENGCANISTLLKSDAIINVSL